MIKLNNNSIVNFNKCLAGVLGGKKIQLIILSFLNNNKVVMSLSVRMMFESFIA